MTYHRLILFFFLNMLAETVSDISPAPLHKAHPLMQRKKTGKEKTDPGSSDPSSSPGLELLRSAVLSTLGEPRLAGHLAVLESWYQLSQASSAEESRRALQKLGDCLLLGGCGFSSRSTVQAACPATPDTLTPMDALHTGASFLSGLQAAFQALPEILSQRLQLFWQTFQLSIFPRFEERFIGALRDSIFGTIGLLVQELRIFIPGPSLDSGGACRQGE
ncbi:uncharacterized protein LOC115074664 [Rhinatrema bivittatum]|uniref:uncharacterized protein LOC115074664 n=1 Tax=Rhinatrema bivittatum TaxID=194408 RepID=UPI001128742A|nr:uncharacterized protein LOC115074664 [Rhinatrema bivittatum]